MEDKTSVPALVPLTDLSKGGVGLYPNGINTPPQWYLELGKALAAKFARLDANGNPVSKGGKAGYLIEGMSNQKQEMQEVLAQIRKGGKMSKAVTFIPGAQGSYDALRIADINSPYWDNIDKMLAQKGMTRKQVQMVYIKEAVSGENDPYPKDVEELAGYHEEIFNINKALYPNLLLYFVTSRISGYYAKKAVSPEPWAFRGGLATKLFIERIIAKGPQEGPLPFWGPYMWAHGPNPRQDGLRWLPQDFETDMTHPSQLGAEKVAKLFFDFMNTSPLTEWFLPSKVLAAKRKATRKHESKQHTR